MKIESLGYYLPPKVVTAEETLQRLPAMFRLPLTDLTGIESVRKVAPGEYALSMSLEAVKKCLLRSQYAAGDIDVIICCNICSHDRATEFSYEPCTAAKVARQFDMPRALCFDINNACAGVFTGLYIAQSLIALNPAKKVLVLSGEHISILAETVFKQNFEALAYSPAEMFPCLTLGDSGVAMILEHSEDAGFACISLETLSDYSHFCTAFATEHGPLMLTNSVRLAQKAMQASAQHLADTLQTHAWTNAPDLYLVPHQTARKVMESGRHLTNQLLKKELFSEARTVINIRERGNTSSTTHWVAIMDLILNNTLQNKDRVAFSVAASGITIGSALYTFDDLPARMRDDHAPVARQKTAPPALSTLPKCENRNLFVEALVHYTPPADIPHTTFDMVREVVKNIVARRVKLHHKIDLIVFCGVYKSEYLSEPSVASMILRASDLTKEERAAHFSDHLFAFDIKNGALSTQTALETAAQILEARHLNNALVVCAEVQHPLHALSDPLALLPGAAAFLLSATPVSGALARLCRSQTLLFPDFQEDHTVCATWKGGNTVLKAHLGSRLNRHYMQGIEQAIDRFFANTGTQWSDYTYAVLPHYALQKGEKQHPLRLPEKAAPILVYTEEGAYTHGIAAAIEILSRHARLGECALVVQIASGLQVSVAEWKF